MENMLSHPSASILHVRLASLWNGMSSDTPAGEVKSCSDCQEVGNVFDVMNRNKMPAILFYMEKNAYLANFSMLVKSC